MVTLQSPSKDGAALLTYLVDDPPHDGESEQRNLWVETIGLMPSSNAAGYIRQFRREWDRAGPLLVRHKNQMRHIIISPSHFEIPYDYEMAEPFAKMVKAFVEKEYPNRRALIVIQQDSPHGIEVDDGNGNKSVKKILHAHIALSDWDIYTLKGVPKEKTSFKWLSKTFDEYISSNYGIEIDHGNDRKRRRYLNKKLVAEGERDKAGKFYSYMDDIKDRINRCASAVSSINDFWDRLKDFGLSVSHKVKKNQDEYETYYLLDLSNISNEIKDRNGKLKKLAKKDQLPGMRSYKQPGYALEDIIKKISLHSDVQQTVTPAKTEKQSINSESPAGAGTNSGTDTVLLNKAIKLTDKALEKLKKQNQEKEKSLARYEQAEAELTYDHTSRKYQKSL